MVRLALLAVGLVWLGCGDGSSGGDSTPDATPPVDLPTTPPTAVRKVVGEGFQSPTDAVASPDGKTFYFAALTTDEPAQPAVFRVAASGGAATRLHAGAPLELVTGLVLACDGQTLYVADGGDGDSSTDPSADVETVNDGGAIYALAADGGAPRRMTTTGIAVPSGLAMGPDCGTLFVSGRDDQGRPAVFTVADDGGAATAILAGPPLASPTGLHVDEAKVSWVMDHAAGSGGSGALFSIALDGKTTMVADNLAMGTPGGVSLVAGGGTAVLGVRDPATDASGLLAIDIATGTSTLMPAPDIGEAAGLRTARGAGVFAVADSEGDAIFAAE